MWFVDDSGSWVAACLGVALVMIGFVNVNLLAVLVS